MNDSNHSNNHSKVQIFEYHMHFTFQSQTVSNDTKTGEFEINIKIGDHVAPHIKTEHCEKEYETGGHVALTS